MKNTKEVFERFLKVVYVLLILIGTYLGIHVWLVNAPVTSNEYGSYVVHCSNGKNFDPQSKPITENYPDSYGPSSFDDRETKSECKFGTAYLIGYGVNLDDVKYTLTYKTSPFTSGSSETQIVATLMVIVIYFVTLEVSRRTLLYIFLGKNFLTLKK